MMKLLPLEGMTIVSIEQAVAAPFATRQLADLGARVIKIERPEVGDFARHYDRSVNGMSSHFIWLNRSKESCALDIKQEESKKLLMNMIAQADVFIHNLAPGAVESLGFGSKKLRERYPHLITCSISGYGENGPYRDKKAYDLLIQCETGAVSVTGTEDTPSKAGMSIADIAAGMYAYSGILTALIARSKSGKGTHLDVSMLEALGEWMGYPLYYAGIGEKELKRTGASHATIYPYGPFDTLDRPVFLGIQNDREWKRFCDHILLYPSLGSDERYTTNAQRFENQDLLEPIITKSLSQYTAEQLIAKLDNEKIANASLNDMAAFRNHPQLEARKRWREVDSPVGKVSALLPPITNEEIDVVMKPIPAVGEHTQKLREEFSG